MFRFANPQYFWLLPVIPALILLFWLAARNRRRRLERFGRMQVLEELMPEVSTGRVTLKFILFCAAVTLLILAAARPQFGSKLREEKTQGVEMMLAVDVSNSMLAEDFEPNRLERTKYAINKLFDGLHQDRVGLIVFAGEPKVQLPITSDYRMAKAFAKRIDPSLVPVQGTAIGKALSQALMSFSGETEENHSRVVILITDGENHEDDALAAARRAAEMGIRIYFESKFLGCEGSISTKGLTIRFFCAGKCGILYHMLINWAGYGLAWFMGKGIFREGGFFFAEDNRTEKSSLHP